MRHDDTSAKRNVEFPAGDALSTTMDNHSTGESSGDQPAPMSIEHWAAQLGLGKKAVLTTTEAADVLRISERSVRQRIKAGTLPHVRLGRRLLIPVPMLLRSLLREPGAD